MLYWRLYIGCALGNFIGLCIFATGFFPTKVVLPGHNVFGNSPGSPFLQEVNHQPQFERVILMVVDAMRADFAFSEQRSSMSFVHSLVRDGSALPFTAFSNPPTVTLPRLKGITTGGTPNFLDAILNIADDKDDSQGMSSQDSWLHQLKYSGRNKSLHFFGDDTWLKLFPPSEFFDVHDGTGSFFVSDFTEVDNNVTRHLDDELGDNADWDGLILHYLGLDHIGHKGGPDSVYMADKQREMDQIFQRLFTHVSNRKLNDTLLVLMGDHGMNEIGNHGASSAGETNAALLFASPKFKEMGLGRPCPIPDDNSYEYYKFINQIDLVPTLASLLNFPVPRNNLGVMILDVLDLWSLKEEKISVLRENCLQMKHLVDAKYSEHDSVYTEIVDAWNELDKEEASTKDYYKFLLRSQGALTQAATNYNYTHMYLGFGLVALSGIVTVTMVFLHLISSADRLKSYIFSFLAFISLYSLHFHGSSLIEEEYQLWWFFSVIFLISFWANGKFSQSWHLLALAIGLRTIRAWNNSGQKFFTKNTIANYLMNNIDTLWLLNIITYTIITFQVYAQGLLVDCFTSAGSEWRKNPTKDFGSFAVFITLSVLSTVSFVFKLCQSHVDGRKLPSWLLWLLKYTCESFNVDTLAMEKQDLQTVSIELSRVFFQGIFILLILRSVIGKLRGQQRFITDITNIITLLLIHQSRIESIPIFLTFGLVKWSLSSIRIEEGKSLKYSIDLCLLQVVPFILSIQNLSFFSIGNTNLLATVDLSNAYNGIKTYDVLIVGLLTFVSNFGVVIFWSLSSLQVIFEPYTLRWKPISEDSAEVLLRPLKYKILLVKCFLTLTFYSLSGLSLIISCINLRFHLFIWTVFSPKLLYFFSWSMLVNLVVDLLFAAITLVFN